MIKPTDVIGRQEEWDRLRAAWEAPTSQLVFVVGRRRVGKSYLLSRFARAVGGVYYQATRRTETEQLAGLTRVVGQVLRDAALSRGAGFTRWESLFDYVLNRVGHEPFALVLDEFPYLVDAAAALPSVLQRLWDHDLASANVKLVLSGSYVTAMERLEAADQPLYGRRTAKVAFAPFGLREVAQFVPDWSTRDKVAAYATFGQLPGHLALIDAGQSLAANVATHLLSPSGRLVDDAQHMLDAFAPEPAVHYSILEAVAHGESTWKGITGRVGRRGGSLSRPLAWLEGMGLLERVAKVSAGKPGRERKVLYRVADPYLTFWYRVVAPLAQAGTLSIVDADALWEEVAAPKLDDHLGPVFEQACRDFVAREARERNGALPFRPLRIGSWWDGAGAEVDVVAVGGRGEVLVGESKWGPVSARHLHRLRGHARTIQTDLRTDRPPDVALFTGRGETDDAVRAEVAAGQALLFTADDLLGQ